MSLWNRRAAAVFAHCVDHGSEQAAALGLCDPCLRPFIRRRVASLHLEAALVADPDCDEDALSKIAWLLAHGHDPAPLGSVNERYQKAPHRALKKSRGVSLILASSLLGLLVFLGIGLWPSPERVQHLLTTVELPEPPPSQGAYVGGGSPAQASPELDEVFRTSLPQLVIDLSQGKPPRAQLESKISQAASPKLNESLKALVSALERVRGSGDHESADALSMAVLAVNDGLAHENLPYFVDSNVIVGADGSGATALLFIFEVEVVKLYQSGSHRLRALRLRRADKLNWSYNLLGFTAAHRREAVVLLGQIERRMRDELLPASDSSSPVPFAASSPDDWGQGWHKEIRSRFAQLLSESLGGLSDDAVLYGETMASRSHMRFALRRKAEERGMMLAELDDFDTSVLDELDPLLEPDERSLLEEMQKQADALESQERFFVERVASTIERHELQHRLDVLAGSLPMPKLLEKYTGRLFDKAGKERPYASHSVVELSAYLADIARAPDPRLRLLELARFALDTELWGSPECHALLVIVEALAEATNTALDGPLVDAGSIQRSRVVDALVTLSFRKDLNEKAATSWQRLFGRELQTVGAVPGVPDREP